jgi:hypothetical protein
VATVQNARDEGRQDVGKEKDDAKLGRRQVANLGLHFFDPKLR